MLPNNILRLIASHADPKTKRTMVVARAIPRSPPRAKPLKFSKEPIDRINPIAYKNKEWKFYVYWNKAHILFKNTSNGVPFLIDKKTGTRKNIPLRLGVGNTNPFKPRKQNHTWQGYIKRSILDSRLQAGQGVRNQKQKNIDANVQKFLGGNSHILNKYSIPNLVYWASKTDWMGNPYVKRGGQWSRYAGPNLTKNNILNNIRETR
jgi:hypothetical protein